MQLVTLSYWSRHPVGELGIHQNKNCAPTVTRELRGEQVSNKAEEPLYHIKIYILDPYTQNVSEQQLWVWFRPVRFSMAIKLNTAGLCKLSKVDLSTYLMGQHFCWYYNFWTNVRLPRSQIKIQSIVADQDFSLCLDWLHINSQLKPRSLQPIWTQKLTERTLLSLQNAALHQTSVTTNNTKPKANPSIQLKRDPIVNLLLKYIGKSILFT